MQNLIQTLRNLGPVRLAAIGAVVLGSVVFFAFLATHFANPGMSLLYGDLDPQDSGKIVGKLEALGVPYELRGDGRQILVPGERALRLRMVMAEEGLPVGGSIGYEIFDRGESLGTTSFVQNVNLVRALEGELARTIRSISQVQEARVHIVLPKRELFSRQQQEPSASVMLKTRGADRLSKSQVMAVQNMVAAAVSGLKPSRISVVDAFGRLLARAGGDGSEGDIGAAANDELRRAQESRLTRTIEEMLEQSIGVGKVRAQVAVEMDFDRLTTSSETYDPDGQVARSVQNVTENQQSSENDSASNVSVQNNLPDAKQDKGNQSKNQSRSARNEETTNFEISKTVKSLVRESGVMRRLSVGILVDGTYAADAGGQRTYQPRSQEELDKLASLVRSAIGLDQKRGDTLEIVNLRFAQTEQVAETMPPLFGLTKADYFRIAEIFVLAVVGILVILLVVRPLVMRTLEALPSALAAHREQALLADQSVDAPALAGPGDTGMSAEQVETMVDMAKVEGRVRQSTVKKISEVVSRHPEETISIIRQWMYKDA
ncbi:MAG TPA: flagellar basal-body MS-ring/collar protein FliF [Alphaproteobacteria bacterium]